MAKRRTRKAARPKGKQTRAKVSQRGESGDSHITSGGAAAGRFIAAVTAPWSATTPYPKHPGGDSESTRTYRVMASWVGTFSPWSSTVETFGEETPEGTFKGSMSYRVHVRGTAFGPPSGSGAGNLEQTSWAVAKYPFACNIYDEHDPELLAYRVRSDSTLWASTNSGARQAYVRVVSFTIRARLWRTGEGIRAKVLFVPRKNYDSEQKSGFRIADLLDQDTRMLELTPEWQNVTYTASALMVNSGIMVAPEDLKGAVDIFVNTLVPEDEGKVEFETWMFYEEEIGLDASVHEKQLYTPNIGHGITQKVINQIHTTDRPFASVGTKPSSAGIVHAVALGNALSLSEGGIEAISTPLAHHADLLSSVHPSHLGAMKIAATVRKTGNTLEDVGSIIARGSSMLKGVPVLGEVSSLGGSIGLGLENFGSYIGHHQHRLGQLGSLMSHSGNQLGHFLHRKHYF